MHPPTFALQQARYDIVATPPLSRSIHPKHHFLHTLHELLARIVRIQFEVEL